MHLALSTDPRAHARSVSDPAIAEVLDRDTGEFVDVTSWIVEHLYQSLIGDRVRLVERMNAGDPKFLCSDCYVPVYLVSRPEDRVFFFRHIREDGSCPARTRSTLSAEEITARKYHGLRESKPHRAIKALIQRSLEADPNFFDVAAEATWRSENDPKRYRRPDVQATCQTLRYAIEVQLSTTFLSVVAGRRAFYRAEGALLLWVFGGFDPAYRRLTTDDLLFSNNSNVFVVDEETAALSEQTGRFQIRCFHREPAIERGKIVDTWVELVVPVDTLTTDVEGQRVFALDYQEAEARLQTELLAAAERQAAFLADLDKRDFWEFWEFHSPGFRHTPENRETWQALRARFARHGVKLPIWPDADGEVRAMLNAFYSLQEDRPIGWNFSKLIEVTHCVTENHPALMSAFGFAVKHFGRVATIRNQDQRGRWRDRLANVAPALNGRDPAFLPNAAIMPLMDFLFPEIASKDRAFWAKLDIGSI